MKSSLFVSAIVVIGVRYLPLSVPGLSIADARALVSGSVFFLYGFVLIVFLLARLIARRSPKISGPVDPGPSACETCDFNIEMQCVLFGRPRPLLPGQECDPRCVIRSEHQAYIDGCNDSGLRLPVVTRLPNRSTEFPKSVNQQSRKQD